MEVTVTLTEDEQEMLLQEARLKVIFNTDLAATANWVSIAAKIREQS